MMPVLSHVDEGLCCLCQAGLTKVYVVCSKPVKLRFVLRVPSRLN